MSEEWNLDHILDKPPEKIIERLKERVEEFKEYREVLDDIGPKEFKNILLLKQEIRRDFKKLSAFYSLQFAEKTDDSEVLAKMSHLDQLQTELSNEVLFFNIWFMHLEDGKAQEFLESEELQDYNYYLEEIRKAKPYTKSEEVEQIISLKSTTGGDAFADLYEIITGNFEFELDGEEGLSQEEVTSKFRSPDPDIREEAYKEVLTKYGENSTVLNEIYKNVVRDWYNEGIKIRGHESPISVRNYYNDIPDEIVDTMLEVVKENKGLFKEYFKLKHELDKQRGKEYPFSRYHIYAPFEAEEKEYSYEESKEIVLDTFKEFDSRVYEAAKEIFDKDHVHSHPKKKKRSGAFCYSIHNQETPYILLNHTDTLRDLFTMIHEFGHGVHGVLAREQVDLMYSSSTPMAETASVFSEMLLAQRMLEDSDENEKKSLLTYLLTNQYATIMRQAYFTFFEKQAHDMVKEGATKEDINKAYVENVEEQFGDMKIPEEFKHEWNYVSHFHFSPFYCYAYSWGNLLVLSLYRMYEERGSEFVDKYVELLSKGGGEAPVDLLRDMGIDPSDKEFWQKGFDVIKEEVEELKSLV